MKKILLLQCFFLAAIWAAVAQTPFNKRGNSLTVKGDMIVVGNSILTSDDSSYANDRKKDNSIELKYIDIDGDGNTFNSSSANVKNPNTSSTCGLKIVKAYLYWAAAYKQGDASGYSKKLDPSKFNKIKFKQGSGSYNTITGEKIHSDDDNNVSRNHNVYVCVADVTQYVTSINNETFTVADVQAPYGAYQGNGYAAGWTLFIIYEDTTKPARNITLFDGFEVVNTDNSPEIKVSGFTTVPSPLPVNAKIAFAALEGESYLGGDEIKIKTNKTNGNQIKITAPGREDDSVQHCYYVYTWYGGRRLECGEAIKSNFFNSTITNENGVNVNRNPAYTNLYGFDAGIFDLQNNGNSIIGNDTTEASFYPSTTQDVFYPFMFAFNVEVITPQIVMEKRVYDSNNNDITGANNIKVGSSIKYQIKFKNIGNDDAKDLVISDVLPANLENNISNESVPTGATYTFTAATRTLKVTIPDNLVKQGSPEAEISFVVKVTGDCTQFRDACSNIIENRAYAKYKGVKNPAELTPSSYNTKFTACGGGVEGPSNFIIADDFNNKCVYKKTEKLCQPTITLTAGAGFDTYVWTTATGTIVGAANGRSIVASSPGVYKVTKTKAGCTTMKEEITVLSNDADVDHPIEKMIQQGLGGEIRTCPSTGRKYPQVYLCGKNASLDLPLPLVMLRNLNGRNFVIVVGMYRKTAQQTLVLTAVTGHR